MADRDLRQWLRLGTRIVVVTMTFALAACGSAAANGVVAPKVEASEVAPTEGSPEQTMLEIREARAHVAPVEGSPERTEFEIH